MLDIEYPCRRKMCNRGRLFTSYDLTQSFHVPQVIQSTGIKTVICPALSLLYDLNKCRTLSCSGIAYSILFLIALLLSLTGRFRISILPHCDAGHRIAVLPKDVQLGTVVRILRLNTVIPCPSRDSIHGDKDRHLSCACATLRLEQMPDIILFRDCTILSFLFLLFSCFPRFSL